MISEYLEQLGLTKTESALYLSLYQNQRLTPVELSKKTRIKRPTVYAAAAELVRKGLIEEQSKKKKEYVLLSPDRLKEYIENQKRQLEEKSAIAQKAIVELESVPRSLFAETPIIKMVETKDIEEHLYRMSPLWAKNSKKTAGSTWYGFQSKKFMEQKRYTKWIDWFWKQGFDVEVKMLTNYSDLYKQVSDKLYGKGKIRNEQGIKYYEGLEFTATQWVVGDYVINIVENGEQSYLIETKDKVMAGNLRNLYRILFDQV